MIMAYGLQVISGLLAIATALASFFFFIKRNKYEELKKEFDDLKKEKESLDSRISKFRTFCAGVSIVEHRFTDVFFIGPRNHGKSALVRTLTEQWNDIHTLIPTPTDFDLLTWISPKFRKKKFFNSDLETNMTSKVQAAVNIYDYAGEERSFVKALEKISQSERYVVVFTISSEPSQSNDASIYFSVTNLIKIKKAIASANGNAISALIVFTKHDLTDFSTIRDPTEVPNQIIASHRLIVDSINSVFGTCDSLLVSAETGFGTNYLSRRLLRTAVDKEGLPL